MQRTRIIESEVSTGVGASNASNINSASCVRLHNITSGIVTVGVSTSVGAATTTFFSMPGNTVEFLEKIPTEVIWTTIGIKAAKVGFTN